MPGFIETIIGSSTGADYYIPELGCFASHPANDLRPSPDLMIEGRNWRFLESRNGCRIYESMDGRKARLTVKEGYLG